MHTKFTKIKTKSGFNKRLATIIVLITAAVGGYFLFFAHAAANNCTAITGGAICDVNQASNGTDAVAAFSDEPANYVKNNSWVDWGVGFRTVNAPINGAKPVHRFNRADITAHFLVIESDPNFAIYKNDPGHYTDEGIFMYAWDNANVSGTQPIYRVNRKALYFLQMYSTNIAWVNQFVSNPDGTWENGGIAFYAYDANYFPPAPATTATKDSDCANQNLQPGDRGACVQWLKGVLNGYGADPKLDTNNNVFDTSTNENARFFVTQLKNRGANVPAYSNVVTKEIWNAFAAGYPALPATSNTPGQSAQVPVRTNTPSGGSSNGGGNSGGNSPKKTTGSNFKTCPKSLDDYLAYPPANYADFSSVQAIRDCQTFWNAALLQQQQAGKKDPFPSTPPTSVNKKKTDQTSLDEERKAWANMSWTSSSKSSHINIWIKKGNQYKRTSEKDDSWEIHIICDIYYNTRLRVWAYAKGNFSSGGSDHDSCKYKKNGKNDHSVDLNYFNPTNYFGDNSAGSFLSGSGGKGDAQVSIYLNRISPGTSYRKYHK